MSQPGAILDPSLTLGPYSSQHRSMSVTPPSPSQNSHELRPSPPLSKSGRPQQVRHLPARYRDIAPKPPTPAISTVAVTMPRLASEMPPDSEATITSQRCGMCLIVLNRYQTAANNFGLWKDYLYRPSHDPDATVAAENLYRPHLSAILPQRAQAEEASLYTNRTVELLLDWQNSGSSAKSNNELNRLVKEVLLHPKFKLDELSKFNATHENQKVDAIEEQSQLGYLRGFHHANIVIEVPSGSKDNAPRSFLIPGLYYCKITTLI